MSELAKWAVCVCTVTLCGTVCRIFLSGDSVSDTARTVISVAVLCAVILPLFGNTWDFSDIFNTTEQETESDEAYLAAQREALREHAENKVREDLLRITEKYGIGEAEIVFDTDILSDGCIHMKQITVYAGSPVPQSRETEEELAAYSPAVCVIWEDGSEHETAGISAGASAE